MRTTVKRGIDVVAASAGLMLLSPMLFVTGLLVRLTMGPPVLFRQSRPGLHGQPFTLYKFRTMRESIESHSGTLADEQRLTRFGLFLRSTSIDELPELWNVLRGDMSLVGPRPLLMEYIGIYTPEQARRHDMRPGITGWAQVNGRNAISWEDKFRCDVWYIDNHSIALDLKILLLTLSKVLTRDGINYPGHVSVEKFQGSARHDAGGSSSVPVQAANRR